MTKILVVNNRNKDSLFLKSIKLLFKNRSYLYEGWEPSEILKNEKPDFVFFDLEKSVNGENVSDMMNGFDVYSRLRITILNPFSFNFNWIKNTSGFISKYGRNIFRGKRRMPEAYSRR